MNAKKRRTKETIDRPSAEEIDGKFLATKKEFNDGYLIHEEIRATGYTLLTEAGVMMHFLVDLNSEELAKAEAEAAKPLPMAEDQLEQRDGLLSTEHIPTPQERAEDVAAAQAALRLRQIKAWGDAADDEGGQEDKAEAIRNHKERLARYRKRKDWEAWVEEDELDIEGDRLLSEIKNYKSEHFFNTGFYA